MTAPDLGAGVVDEGSGRAESGHGARDALIRAAAGAGLAAASRR